MRDIGRQRNEWIRVQTIEEMRLVCSGLNSDRQALEADDGE